jgi:hypothetical protein
MSEKGSGLPENYTRFYQGELRIRLAGQLLYVRVQYLSEVDIEAL